MSSMDSSNYQVIHEGTKEFEEYDLNKQIDGFPFLVIRDDDGQVLYAAAGYMDARQLGSKIERLSGSSRAFNLRRARRR
jgi:thioredoxin-related protein